MCLCPFPGVPLTCMANLDPFSNYFYLFRFLSLGLLLSFYELFLSLICPTVLFVLKIHTITFFAGLEFSSFYRSLSFFLSGGAVGGPLPAFLCPKRFSFPRVAFVCLCKMALFRHLLVVHLYLLRPGPSLTEDPALESAARTWSWGPEIGACLSLWTCWIPSGRGWRGGGSALLFTSPTDALSSVWDPRRHCASGPRAEVPVLPTAETRLAVSPLPGWRGGSLGSRWDSRI